MGERKVLNKYYPPDFDPKKLPKLDLPKNFQCVIRTMAPFTMRCLTCGNYVYRGKKFNARKETVEGEEYLGIRIHRFYIRCPVCLSEIIFKTDPKNTDYAIETGAYRTFQAEHLAEMEEERLKQEKEEDEANNPMLALENRTKESRREMDVIDALEDIRDWNARKASVKFEDLMENHLEAEKQAVERQEQEDEALVNKLFSRKNETVKRLEDDDDDEQPPALKMAKVEAESSIATNHTTKKNKNMQRSKLAGLVVKKKTAPAPSSDTTVQTLSSATHAQASQGQDSRSQNTLNLTASNKDRTGTKSVSSLGLLGTYSGSSSESDD